MARNTPHHAPILVVLGLACVHLIGGCTATAESCFAGAEGCPCNADGCLGDLVCEAGICIDPSTGGDTGGDEDDDVNTDDVPPDDDGTSQDDNVPPPCGKSGLTVEGTVSTNLGDTLAFDRVVVGVRHKRDIDPTEDGCINQVELTFTQGDGCRLEITAGQHLDDGALRVIESSLVADSQCPGFRDDEEGIYQGGESHSYVVLSQWAIDEENVAETCFIGSATLYLDAVLQRGSTDVTLEGTLTVTGDFESSAQELSCPEA